MWNLSIECHVDVLRKIAELRVLLNHFKDSLYKIPVLWVLDQAQQVIFVQPLLLLVWIWRNEDMFPKFMDKSWIDQINFWRKDIYISLKYWVLSNWQCLDKVTQIYFINYIYVD